MRIMSPVAHVPGVFSHYSPSTGSALITKVHEHAKALEHAGGKAYVLVNEARDVGYDEGSVVRFASPRAGGVEYLTRGERRVDALTGNLAGWRPRQAAFWRPAVDAVPSDTRVIVIYNQPAAITRSFRPPHGALRVLHLGNDVFRTWRPRHIVAALKAYDLTVAVSDFLADSINARLPRGSTLVRVLRNGVDVDAFRPSASRVDDRVPEILFVGNMVRHKGAHHLLRAAAVLAQRGVPFSVRVVGSWGLSSWVELTPYERELREIAAPLGSRVTFQPFVTRDQIPGVYQQASVFCMPVIWDEPAGQVVTEAMATGLPVVAAARGGIPEYLGSGGVYVEPSAPEAMADALEPLLLDREHRLRVGSLLRARAQSMTWDVRVREFDQILHEEQR